jgi:hypothetical protein
MIIVDSTEKHFFKQVGIEMNCFCVLKVSFEKKNLFASKIIFLCFSDRFDVLIQKKFKNILFRCIYKKKKTLKNNHYHNTKQALIKQLSSILSFVLYH